MHLRAPYLQRLLGVVEAQLPAHHHGFPDTPVEPADGAPRAGLPAPLPHLQPTLPRVAATRQLQLQVLMGDTQLYGQRPTTIANDDIIIITTTTTNHNHNTNIITPPPITTITTATATATSSTSPTLLSPPIPIPPTPPPSTPSTPPPSTPRHGKHALCTRPQCVLDDLRHPVTGSLTSHIHHHHLVRKTLNDHHHLSVRHTTMTKSQMTATTTTQPRDWKASGHSPSLCLCLPASLSVCLSVSVSLSLCLSLSLSPSDSHYHVTNTISLDNYHHLTDNTYTFCHITTTT